MLLYLCFFCRSVYFGVIASVSYFVLVATVFMCLLLFLCSIYHCRSMYFCSCWYHSVLVFAIFLFLLCFCCFVPVCIIVNALLSLLLLVCSDQRYSILVFVRPAVFLLEWVLPLPVSVFLFYLGCYLCFVLVTVAKTIFVRACYRVHFVLFLLVSLSLLHGSCLCLFLLLCFWLMLIIVPVFSVDANCCCISIGVNCYCIFEIIIVVTAILLISVVTEFLLLIVVTIFLLLVTVFCYLILYFCYVLLYFCWCWLFLQ